MTYPLTLPPDRENEDALVDNHPGDHNTLKGAVSGIYGELGAAPSGAHASVQARLEADEAAITAAQGDADAAQAAVDAHVADATGAHAATAVAFTPAGGIAATTVQAAIEEVASESADAAHEHDAGDITTGVLSDAVIPDGIARDAEVASAIGTAVSDHEAAADPHAQYTTGAEVASAIAAHEAAVDPHGQYTTDAEVQAAIDAHEGAVDPHSQYLTQDEANALYAPTGTTGVSDHGDLTGLDDPADHEWALPHTGGTLTDYHETLFRNDTASGPITIDPADGPVQVLTLVGDVDLDIVAGVEGVASSLSLKINQDASTAYAVTYSAAFDWGDAGPPDLSGLGTGVYAVLVNLGGATWDSLVSGSGY